VSAENTFSEVTHRRTQTNMLQLNIIHCRAANLNQVGRSCATPLISDVSL